MLLSWVQALPSKPSHICVQRLPSSPWYVFNHSTQMTILSTIPFSICQVAFGVGIYAGRRCGKALDRVTGMFFFVA